VERLQRIQHLSLLVVTSFTFFLAAASPAAGQIVNTLSGFDPDERGFGGSVSLGIDAEGGNTDVFEANVESSVRHVTDAQTLRAMLGYDFERADGDDQSDDTFVHLRHNYRLVDRTHSLAFVQWQRNPFQRLETRVLVGAGARLDLLRADAGHLTFGAAHMGEFETVEDEEATTAQRLSAYLDASWSFGNGVEIAANTFYQPRWSDFGDARAIASVGLESSLGRGFALAITGKLTYDADPPDDVETTDWKTSTGLNYRF